MPEVLPYSLHFSAAAWAQIGALDGRQFDALRRTLEHFALRAAEWAQAFGHPRVDPGVPLLAGTVVAECVLDDHRQLVLVEQLEFVGDIAQAA